MPANCFPKSDLEQYLQGRVDDDLSDAIEIHLAECERCEDTVASLGSADDTLIRTLKVKAGETRLDDQPAWIKELAAAPHVVDEPRTKRHPSDDSLAKAVPRELGDYQLLSVLGRGGMSVVFSARHKHLGREVAIKLLLPTNQQTVSRERFTREMRAVGALDHPAIVRATDAGESGNTLYLVMDCVDGVDLNRVSKLHGPMSVNQACAIVREVATGLAYAHERQIVHRDVKPSNIMLTRNGQAKILDFGLARIQSSTGDVSLHTTMGQLLGTLDYMAPEQAGGETVDHRADVYGLGATLFKLLTGTPPHGRSSEVPIVEFLSRLASKEADRLDEHRSDIPNEVGELVAEMLQAEPSARVAGMKEVIDRLAPFADGADLTQLATDAMDAVVEDRPQDLTTLRDSLASILPTETETAPKSDQPLSPSTSTANANGRSWFPGALALASFGGIVALAIAMTINSPEGEIRITSELNDVKVDIVDEENRVDTIMVDQGKESTTVRTGRYRIRVASPLDDVTVTPASVTVSKGKVFEVAITKKNASSSEPESHETNQPGEQRDPVVALNAKIELEETIKALEEAKKNPEGSQRIPELEAKIINLRSLSLPIPTQPVYRGRTLDDWTAQMKFETDSTARRAAADAVYELSHTIPIERRIRTLLQIDMAKSAGALGRFVDEFTRQDMGTRTFQVIRAADDPKVFATQLAAALHDQDKKVRSLALLVCLELRKKMQETPEDWKLVLDSLRKRASEPTENSFDSSVADSSTSVRKIVYASCLRDKDLAAQVTQQIDSKAVSYLEAFLLVLVSADQEFGSREDQLQWFSHYLGKRGRSHVYDKWADYSFMNLFQFGPFQDIAKSKSVTPDQKADLHKVTQILLSLLEEGQDPTAIVDDSDRPADPLGTLTYIISIVPPEGELRQRVVELLNARLAEALERRKTIDFETAERFCTPAEIAGALTMLTGELPAALTRRVKNEGSEVFRHLLRLQSELATEVDLAHTARDFRSNNEWHFLLACEWFPREATEILSDAGQGPVATAFTGRSSGRTIEFDPRLAVGLAIHVDNLKSSWIVEERVQWFQDRHPKFTQLVEKVMRESPSYSVAGTLFSAWKNTQSEEQAQTQLVDWLKQGDGVRTKVAVNHLINPSGRPGRAHVPKELQSAVAKAYDRLGQLNMLTASDFRIVSALGSKVPNASRLAGDFLVQRLTNPKAYPVTTYRGRGFLRYVFQVFKRKATPEQVEEVLTLIDNGDFVSREEASEMKMHARTLRGEPLVPPAPQGGRGDAPSFRGRTR